MTVKLVRIVVLTTRLLFFLFLNISLRSYICVISKVSLFQISNVDFGAIKQLVTGYSDNSKSISPQHQLFPSASRRGIVHVTVGWRGIYRLDIVLTASKQAYFENAIMSIMYLYLVIERKRKYLLFVLIDLLYKVTIGFKYMNWCLAKYADVESGYMHSYMNQIYTFYLLRKLQANNTSIP